MGVVGRDQLPAPTARRKNQQEGQKGALPTTPKDAPKTNKRVKKDSPNNSQRPPNPYVGWSVGRINTSWIATCGGASMTCMTVAATSCASRTLNRPYVRSDALGSP